MRFEVKKGNFNKFFVECTAENVDEYWMYNEIQKTVSRSEYKPFIRSMNKTITKTYWYNNRFFPAQFLNDVRRALNPILEYRNLPKIQVIGEEKLHMNIDRSEFNDYVYNFLKFPDKYDLRSEKYLFQPESAYNALCAKTARIEIGTSGGKTMITYLYCRYLIDRIIPKIRSKAKQIVIVVPRKILVTQLQSDFSEYQSLMPEDKQIRVATCYDAPKKQAAANVIVGTFQTLREYEEDFYEDIIAFICDEVHTGKAYSIRSEIFPKMKNLHFAFGMSGTMPKYNTLDYIDIVSVFGDVVFERKAKTLIETGVSTPVKIHVIKINYKGEIAKYSTRLKEAGIIGTEKYHEEKNFVQHIEERNNIMAKLMEHPAFEGNSLVLVETVSYCKELKEYFKNKFEDRPVEIIYGNTKDKIREDIKKNIEESSNYILIATYETMSTGVSIKRINNIFFPDGGKSYIRIIQSIGRGLRLHKDKQLLHVFDLQDNMRNSALWNQALERNKIYREEGHKYTVTETTIGTEWEATELETTE